MNQPELDPASAKQTAANVESELSDSHLAVLMNDASIDQIMALDLDLCVRAWNKACEDVTGIPRAQALGKPFYEVRVGAEAFSEISEALEMALKGFKSFLPWEKSAYAGFFEHHFIPLKSNDQVIGVLVIIHDVAHRIKAENQLQNLNRILAQKNKELQQKTEELTNFNWIASHDLKEPLRKIYTFIEMVATKEGIKLTDNARTNLRRAQSAVQRMGLLTDDIVTFSQVAAPSEQLAMVDLQEVLRKSLELHQRTIENNSALVEADQLPQIHGYPELVQLLFNHMLGNALKFHAEGAQPRVAVRYALTKGKEAGFPDAEDEADYHVISFEDNGIGFDMSYAEKIFGMFQRLHQQGQYRGTGMGLPICRKVVDAHYGFITVNSVEGEGSRFTCYLKDLSPTAAKADSAMLL
jgi:signal transduction histidine kinase